MTPSYSITIDEELLSTALQLPVATLREAFTDGRVASRFVEYWAEKMFGVEKHRNTNHKSSDAFVRMPDGELVEVSIRTLTTNGIRFQDSKFMGAGRSCTIDDLKESIRRSDRWLVFDVRFFPIITAYKVKCSTLEHWIDSGELTVSGLSAYDFCRMLNRDDQPLIRQLELIS